MLPCSCRRAIAVGVCVAVGMLGPGARTVHAQGGVNAIPAYGVSDSIVVGHVVGRWFDIDVVNRKLYGAGGAIIDIDQRRIIGHIADSTPGTEYLVPAEDLRGLTNTGVIFNPATGQVGEHLPVHGEGIAYEPITRRAFLLSDTLQVVNLAPSVQPFGIMQSRGMGRGGMGGGGMGMGPGPTTNNNARRDTAIRRIPPVRLTATIVGELALPAAAASGAADGQGHLYLALPARDTIVRLDGDKVKLSGGRPAPTCHAPTALAIDNVHARLFLGCDSSIAVMSLSDGHISAQLTTQGHPTELAFDAGAGLLFVPVGEHGVVIIHEEDPEHYTIAQTVTDPRVLGASALVLDPTTHRVFVPHVDADGTFRFAVLAPEF